MSSPGDVDVPDTDLRGINSLARAIHDLQARLPATG